MATLGVEEDYDSET